MSSLFHAHFVLGQFETATPEIEIINLPPGALEYAGAEPVLDRAAAALALDQPRPAQNAKMVRRVHDTDSEQAREFAHKLWAAAKNVNNLESVALAEGAEQLGAIRNVLRTVDAHPEAPLGRTLTEPGARRLPYKGVKGEFYRVGERWSSRVAPAAPSMSAN